MNSGLTSTCTGKFNAEQYLLILKSHCIQMDGQAVCLFMIGHYLIHDWFYDLWSSSYEKHKHLPELLNHNR